MKAIKDTGNNLLAAIDKHDSVGVLDNYFPDVDFFTEFERFERHIEKIRRNGIKIDYVSICSPNYLHDAHIRFGLRIGADVICEKPVVLNPWNIDALLELERETGKNVNTILQLRLHPAIVSLKTMVEKSNSNKVYNIDLNYITSRGKWYQNSWKGDINKSGGLTTNIGVHFFDMLMWIFGEVQENIIIKQTNEVATGRLILKRAYVTWSLSINVNDLPKDLLQIGKKTFRSLVIDGKAFEFSDGFTELHTQSYKSIISGAGFPLIETRAAIQLVHDMRNAKLK